MIISMYENIKSRVKYDNQLSKAFTCFFKGWPRGMFILIFILYVY